LFGVWYTRSVLRTEHALHRVLYLISQSPVTHFSRVSPPSDMLHINDGLAVQTHLPWSEYFSGLTTVSLHCTGHNTNSVHKMAWI